MGGLVSRRVESGYRASYSYDINWIEVIKDNRYYVIDAAVFFSSEDHIFPIHLCLAFVLVIDLVGYDSLSLCFSFFSSESGPSISQVLKC